MKIESVEIYQLKIRLRDSFVISLGAMDHAENIIVIIRTDTGMTGFGECSPFLSINGENMESCFVIARHLARLVVGKDPCNTEGCNRAMDSLVYGNSSIKSAFDIALHDIASQKADLPLFAYLGGRNDKIMMTDYTVSLGDPAKMAEDAFRIIEEGFRIIKVKLGDKGEKDVERIKRIREAIGDSIPLRIDANQGWETDEAIRTLNNLAPFGIEHCEEPVSRWKYRELPGIRRSSPIPVMADESCCDHHDAERLVELGACDSINLKLGKSAGFHKSLKIMRIAEKAGIHLQVGGFLESRLGFTAAAHLALCSANIVHFDLDSPLLFTEDPVTGGIAYSPNGVVILPDKPGLGATIGEDALHGLKKTVVTKAI